MFSAEEPFREMVPTQFEYKVRQKMPAYTLKHCSVCIFGLYMKLWQDDAHYVHD